LRGANAARQSLRRMKSPSVDYVNSAITENQMRPEHIFPILLVILDIGAAIVCLLSGDTVRFVYWIAAAVLTVCVTIR